MKIIADMHIHTIASTHAYSTLTEVVQAAGQAGLCAVAFTDHGPAMPGSPREYYFHNFGAVPKMLDGILVLKGAEINVMSYRGACDMDEHDCKDLDLVIASMHDVCITPADRERVTQGWLNIAKKPYIDVIGHSGSPKFTYDYDRVIPEFGRMGKLVEINENSHMVRQAAVSNCVKIARSCKKHGVPVVVNSDAHFHTRVGVVPQSLMMLKEIDFPEELIINADRDRFMKYLADRGKL